MKKTTPLLELRGVCKTYDHIEALKSVDLSVYAGEIVAIVGDNGAGKSTLANIMTGVTSPDSGIMLRDGREVTFASVKQASDQGIAAVFQNQEFCENLDVSANLFLGNEQRRRCRLRDDESMVRGARKALASLTANIRPSQSIASLSGGQRQTVAIARTLLHDPSIIVMDEPTASLSVIQTAEVLDYIKRLRAQGCSIVMICHNLPDVFAVSDRIVVMRRGHIASIHDTRETTYEQIIAEISGVKSDGDAGISTRKISRHVRGLAIDRRAGNA